MGAHPPGVCVSMFRISDTNARNSAGSNAPVATHKHKQHAHHTSRITQAHACTHHNAASAHGAQWSLVLMHKHVCSCVLCVALTLYSGCDAHVRVGMQQLQTGIYAHTHTHTHEAHSIHQIHNIHNIPAAGGRRMEPQAQRQELRALRCSVLVCADMVSPCGQSMVASGVVSASCVMYGSTGTSTSSGDTPRMKTRRYG